MPPCPMPDRGWRAFRHDPMHLPELAILNVLPSLSPRVVQWRAAQVVGGTADARDRLAYRTVRRCVLRAGEAGAIASPPAVINAITDAVGHEDVTMPATPQVVWRAAQKAVNKRAAE